MKRADPVTLDIVIPIYNEEEALPALFERLQVVFAPDALRAAAIERVRFLIIDDGSTDRSAEIVARFIREGTSAVLYRLSRNFGHQSAVSAGLDRSTADLVAVLDADLQDPPEIVLDMVRRWREGFDVIHAQRAKRSEGPLKRFGYWGFYRIASFLSEIDIPLDAGDFCLMDRRVVDAVNELPEKLRFPRVLRAWVGFRQTSIPCDRPARQAGKPKYTLRKLYSLATDGIASSSIRLLKLAQFAAFSFALVTVAIVVLMLALVAIRPLELQTLLFLIGYILVAAGNFVVTICLYILGAYVGRTYLEAKGRPAYLIMEVVDGG